MHALMAFALLSRLPGLAASPAVGFLGTQDMAFAFFGCVLFSGCLFVYVFYRPGDVESGEEKTRHMYLGERKDAAYENLRDLNFEYKAGKLSEQDYAMQRASLEDEAALILAEMESIEQARSRSQSQSQSQSNVARGTRRPAMPKGGRA